MYVGRGSAWERMLSILVWIWRCRRNGWRVRKSIRSFSFFGYL